LNNTIIKKKICLIGAFGVGKTSLVQRFVYNRFDESYLSTIGVRVAQKDIEAEGEGRTLRMLIWDIEGYEAGNPIVKNYYLGAAGGILVGDVSRPDTFSDLSRLLSQFKTINPQAVTVFAANKIDLIPDISTVSTMLKKTEEDLDSRLFLTSAKDGSNVEQLFFFLNERLNRLS